MAAIVSLATLMFGSALAAIADRHPAYVAMLERGAGALMVAGLACWDRRCRSFPDTASASD